MYGLLGELRIGRDRPYLPLPSGYTLTLLAALLLHANHEMSKADLIRAAWGDEGATEAQLYKRVKEVRDLLAQAGRQDDLKTRAKFGYELRVAEEDLDSLWFQRLVQQARHAQSASRIAEEMQLLRQALALWRGARPLSNVPGDAFRPEIAALEQRRKRAAVRLFDLELALDGHERILDDLIQLAADHPVDRRLRQQLMIALHRCGHSTDATAAYELYREQLVEQTGGEPDPELRELYFAIARGDEPAVALVAASIAERAGTLTTTGTAVPRQLPPTTPLVGRDELAAETAWLLRREPDRAPPIIVISGAGGIGKTALAVRASHEASDHYPDGQLYAELHSAVGQPVDTGELMAQFLRAFGVPRVPETKAERLAAYRTLLADRRVLVVLDDAADGAQVSDLVPANPNCAVVVTSRTRMPELAGAHHVAPLAPLDREHSTTLFLQVVASAGIDPVDHLDAVDRVIGLCGGLPLALRIAGSLRVRDHPRPTADLADRLARQGPFALAYGNLSLARTIGAGFDRLTEPARRLFLGLGQLRLPDFPPWAAAALLDDLADLPASGDVGAALSQLAASFMVEPVDGRPRYRFHDLTRDYADLRARAELGSDAIGLAWSGYRALLTLVRRAHARLYGGDFEVVHSEVAPWAAPPDVLAEVDTAPLEWFERERANIRAAVDHCATLGMTDLCWDLAVSAHEFYTIRGYFDDWYATHAQALRACRAHGDARGEGVVLACLGQPALIAGRRRGGDVSGPADLDRAVRLLTAARDRHGQAIALRTLGNALRRLGQLSRPLALFNDALGHYAASGDLVGQCQTLRFIGQTHLDRGELPAALRALARATTVARQLGGGRLVAQTGYWVGQTQLAVGDVDAAEAAFADVFEVYRDDPGVGHAYARHGMGDVAIRRGQYATAERHLAVAGDLATGSDLVLDGCVQLSTGELQRALHQPDLQILALTAAAERFAECGSAYLETRAQAALGVAHAEQGNHAAAMAAWSRVVDLYTVGGVPEADRIFAPPG